MGVKQRLLNRPATLRSHLVTVVLTTMVPLFVFSVVMVLVFARSERATFERGARQRTLALLTAVDTELKSSITSLQALATSRYLETENFSTFYDEAARVIKTQPSWLTINLASPNGQQLVNLQRPFDGALPRVTELASLRQVLQTGRPAIGRVSVRSTEQRLAFPVRVPVIYDGVIKYVLTALVNPQSLADLLAAQRLPSDWVATVLDGNNRIVARTVNPKRTIGQLASPSLRAALSRSPEGWFYGSTIDGTDVYAPYNRSAWSGWTVAIGIPAAAVEASFRKSLLYVACFGLIFLGCGIALALFLSNRTARSIGSLANVALDMISGKSSSGAEAASDRISEVAAVRESLLTASRLIRERSEERDRVETALRQSEAQLRETDRRKDEFLAMLSHELRNPLGVISTIVHLMRGKIAAGSELGELREILKHQIDQMGRLVDDLLEISRITHGRVQVKSKPCDFTEIVGEGIEDHRRYIQESGLHLLTELPKQPLWVMGDRARLAQVITNALNIDGEPPVDRSARLCCRKHGIGCKKRWPAPQNSDH